MGRTKKFTNATPDTKPITVEKETVEDVKEVVTEDTVKEEKPVEAKKEKKEVEAEAVIVGVNMSLNIRKEPKVRANNQIAILGKGTKVIVMSPDKEYKGDGESWLKIKLKKDADDKDQDNVGYAMKKYIRIL